MCSFCSARSSASLSLTELILLHFLFTPFLQNRPSNWVHFLPYTLLRECYVFTGNHNKNRTFNFVGVQPLLCVRYDTSLAYFDILGAHLTAKDAVKISLGYKQVLLRWTTHLNVRIWEFFCAHVTHITVIIFLPANIISTKSVFRKFAFFSAKSTTCSITQRPISQETAFKKSKHPLPFLAKL